MSVRKAHCRRSPSHSIVHHITQHGDRISLGHSCVLFYKLYAALLLCGEAKGWQKRSISMIAHTQVFTRANTAQCSNRVGEVSVGIPRYRLAREQTIPGDKVKANSAVQSTPLSPVSLSRSVRPPGLFVSVCVCVCVHVRARVPRCCVFETSL